VSFKPQKRDKNGAACVATFKCICIITGGLLFVLYRSWSLRFTYFIHDRNSRKCICASLYNIKRCAYSLGNFIFQKLIMNTVVSCYSRLL